MEYYVLVKQLHMASATLSFFGFLLRGYWMLKDCALLRAKLTKILPHVIDSFLLVSAIYLVVFSKMYPFSVNWITAKVVLLVIYIIAGIFALKRGKTKKSRLTAFIIAIMTILAIFATASIKPSLAI